MACHGGARTVDGSEVVSADDARLSFSFVASSLNSHLWNAHGLSKSYYKVIQQINSVNNHNASNLRGSSSRSCTASLCLSGEWCALCCIDSTRSTRSFFCLAGGKKKEVSHVECLISSMFTRFVCLPMSYFLILQ